MLDLVAAALGQVVGETVLLGPDREGWTSWPDSVHASGPLAGIATALSRAETDHVLVVAVDQPLIRRDTLQALVELSSSVPVVPVDRDGVRQVTCALYPTAISSQAREVAIAGGSIQTLLDQVSFRPITPAEWESWGEDGRSWFSVDSPEEAAEAERRLSG